jgi:sulfite exporter TauE/SafE
MTALVSTILLSSLVGSVHCIAMCGPLVGMHGGALRLALLHSLGRLTTYVALGALAGTVGRAVDLAGNLGTVQRAATIVSGGVIIAWGLHQLAVAIGWARDPKLKTTAFASSLLRIGKRRAGTRAWLVGVLTGLLPCGWLWAFVVSAAGTGSPVVGMIVMATFWLGTVPAMTGVLVVGGWIKRRMPIVTAGVLIVLGVVTLASRWSDAGTKQVKAPSCHEVKP